MDEHYARLRQRALTALDDHETGALSDADLIFVLETTCQLLERTYSDVRSELWAASVDLDVARYAIPVSEIGPQDEDEENVRAALKLLARRRARAALDS